MKDEKNYFYELLWVNSLLGDLNSSLLINNSKFNTVPPKDIKKKVNQIQTKLNRLHCLYKKQYNLSKFDMER